MNFCLLVFVLLGLAVVRVRTCGKACGFDKEAVLPLRGLLALGIVLGHLDTATRHYYWLLRATHWTHEAVAVFLFVSGYGLWKSYAMAADADSWRSGFARRSSVRLLPPLVILGLAWAVYLWPESIVSTNKLTGFLSSGVGCPWTPHCWYVVYLVLWYVGFFVTLAFFTRRMRGVVMLGLSVIGWISFKYVLHWTQAWWAYSFCFPMGVAFSAFEKTIRAEIARRPLTCYAVPLAVFGALAVFSFLGGSIKSVREVYYLATGPAVALCLFGSDILKRIRPLCWLGVISYEIYLVHGLFIDSLKGFQWHPMVLVSVVLVLTVLAAIPLWRIDDRIACKLRERRGR